MASLLPDPSLSNEGSAPLSAQPLTAASLLIGQKPLGDKDLQCLDTKIPDFGGWDNSKH